MIGRKFYSAFEMQGLGFEGASGLGGARLFLLMNRQRDRRDSASKMADTY
jgi:hypothetical protein